MREKLLITTHVEFFSDCQEEMRSLNNEHYKEISEHHKHGFPLNPDYMKYLIKEQDGELLYLTLRHKGKLEGYFIGFIGPGLHYRDCLTLVMDIIYVGKNIRGQKAGDLLVNAVKEEAKRRGVRLVLMGYKEAHKQFLPKIYSEAGFKPFDNIMALWLE